MPERAYPGICPARLPSRRPSVTIFRIGGSSFVPAARRIFADPFGDGRLRGGDRS
jgi:hypothetical protein